MNTEVNYAKKLINYYTNSNENKLIKLKKLNRKAKHNALLFSYIFGCISSLTTGIGMCFALDVFKLNSNNLMITGVIFGIVGIFGMGMNYRIYKDLVITGKNRYSDEIIELANEIINE